MRRLLTAAALLLALAAPSLAVTGSSPFEALARDIFRQLVEIDTSAHAGTTRAVEAVAARLREAGFGADNLQLLGPTPTRQNLVVRLRGSGERRPLLLLAHLDVVSARREDWSVDPFTFLEKGGHFYGRGTSDDKAMASILAANIIRLRRERFAPDRDIIVALTADEEAGSLNGVQWLLANRRELIDAALAISEGGAGEMKDGRNVVNEIQASEKVYQDFQLEVTNPGGHSARPVHDNAVYRLSEALLRIADLEFPLDVTDVTRAYFARMAPLQVEERTRTDMMGVAQHLSDGAAAERLSRESAYYNALLRTTCVATRTSGGHANNALPESATAIVNCRIIPGESVSGIRARLAEAIEDSAVSVTAVGEPQVSAASPLTPELMGAVESVTEALWPGVVVVPVMGVGATDGVYLRNAGIPTYGIEGLFRDATDDRSHGQDERIGVRQYLDALEFHYRLTKALATSASPQRTR